MRLRKKLLQDFYQKDGQFTARVRTGVKQYSDSLGLDLSDSDLDSVIESAIEEKIQLYIQQFTKVEEKVDQQAYADKEAEVQAELGKTWGELKFEF